MQLPQPPTQPTHPPAYSTVEHKITYVNGLFFSVMATYPPCPDGNDDVPFDVENEASPSPWDGLTLSEITNVRDYLMDQEDLDLTENIRNLERKINYIYLMDLLTARKDEVLAYLDGSGAKPERYAKVIIYRYMYMDS